MALTDNLVTYYKLDGDSIDVNGVRNGTDTAITYNAGNGIIVQGAGFNGTSSGIQSGVSTNIGADATLSVWIKTTQVPSGQNPMLFGFRDVSGGDPIFVFNLDNGGLNVSLYCRDNLGNSTHITSDSVTINNGVWHHLVATKAGGNTIVYIDGVENGSDSISFPGNFNGLELHIGHDSSNSEYYAGAIDECGYWSRAITPTEVSELYNGGIGLPYPFERTLDHFAIDTIPDQDEDVPFIVTIRAIDQYGDTLTGFVDTVDISTNESAASIGEGTTTAFVAGVGTHQLTITEPFGHTVVVSVTNITATGTSNTFSVTAAPPPPGKWKNTDKSTTSSFSNVSKDSAIWTNATKS